MCSKNPVFEVNDIAYTCAEKILVDITSKHEMV